METSRIQNSIRNIVYGLFNRVISILGPFIIRTMIIKYMGEEYLGVNSLFSSILQVLNLSELGFSSAIVVNMYKPIVEKDYITINALLNLYKKIYKVIGLCILVVGLGLMIFLPYLINGSYPGDINIYLLFFLYLINTSISYLFFAYKKAVLIANQRSDYIEKIGATVRVVISVMQIGIIYFTKNITFYVFSNVICTLIDNLLCAALVDKKYPEFKANGNVESSIKQKIFINVKALAMQKMGMTVSTSLDNIVISSFLGLSTVAIFGNYNYVIGAIMILMGLVYGSVTASIGNSIISETIEKNHKDFNNFSFMNVWISGWCSICFVCLSQPFMELWVGEKLMLDFQVVILLAIQFYITMNRKIVLTYKDAIGLWNADRFKPLVGSLVNLIFNIFLVNVIGVAGVIISTIISFLLIELPWETYILFRDYFKKSTKIYYSKMICFLFANILVGFVTYLCSDAVQLGGIVGLIIKLFICIIVPNSLLIMMSYKLKEFNEMWKLVKKVLKVN